MPLSQNTLKSRQVFVVESPELHAAGDLIGVKILNASTYIRDCILESVPGRLMRLTRSEV